MRKTVFQLDRRPNRGPVNSVLFGANDFIARTKFTVGSQTGFLITFVMVISLISGLYDPISTTKSENLFGEHRW